MLEKRQSDPGSTPQTGSTDTPASSSPQPSSDPPTTTPPSSSPVSPTPTPTSTPLPSSSSPPSSEPSTPPVTTTSVVPSSSPSSTSTPEPTSTTSSVDSTSSSSSSSSSSDRTSSTSTSDRPTTTFSSTVFVLTTNSLGQTTSFAPPEITSTFTSTLSNGGVVTFTEVVANPTLSPNNNSSSSSQFFHNKGAVAGVFLIVGLAAASICLWIFFFIRRRRRRRRIEHESAVSASLAAAGYNRAPIDDEEDFGPGPGMQQRYSSLSSHPTVSTPITEEERAAGPAATLYDPYAGYNRPVGGVAGYVPARSDSPPQYDRDNSYSSGVSRPSGAGHAPRHSTGSSDPLLAGIVGAPLGTPGPSVPPTPMLPTRSPRRLAAAQLQQSQEKAVASSTRDSEERSSSQDDRLDPALVTLQVDKKSQDLRDDMDYSRPVLEVRNRADSKK